MRKLLLEALRCAETPRRPLWILRQAGRYLPEYRELRARAPFEALLADAELAAEVTLMPVRRFPLDAAIVFADLMSPVPALGIDVRFDPGPVIEKPLRTAREIGDLRLPEPGEAAPLVCETLRRVAKALPDGVALVGFAGAPLTLAAYLVEGSGAKEFPALRTLLYADPDAFDRLLETLSRLVAGYAIDQAEAGAEVVQIFDSWAGLFGLEEWRAHVRPPLVALLEEVGRAGVPRIIFANGAPHLALEYARLPAEAVHLCWRSDLARVREAIGFERALQGNLDPAVLCAGPEATRRAALGLLSRVERRGHIVNLGHGITPEAPLESVEALIEAVEKEVRP